MNPYVKIAIGAMAAVYLAPAIQQRFVIVELDTKDAVRNQVTFAGIAGLVAAGVYVILGMATGKAPA
jgi:hypothetical protein